jgi:hypothetical protein
MNFGRRIPATIPEAQHGIQNVGGQVRNETIGVTSKDLLREINLFIPETIGIGIGAMAAIFCIAFGYLFNSMTLLIVGAIVPAAILIIFYMVRLLLFMPNKHRHLTIRFFGSRALKLSVDDYKDREVKFDANPMSPKIKIVNLMRHFNFATGKPVILLQEGEPENITVSRGDNISQIDRDFDALCMSAMNIQHAYDILTMQKEEKNKDMLILIVMIAVAAIGMGTLYMLWQNQDMLTQMATSMNSLGSAIAQQAKTVVDSNVSRIVVQ